jgi:hypothetical protein
VLRRCVAACLCALLLPACAARTLEITSDPPGATVYVNDQEIGRTPVKASFTHYGTYDVLLFKDGYEPLRTRARARTPIYEIPPLDLLASAAGARTTIRWHFTLRPAIEASLAPEVLEAELLGRARALREEARRADTPPK